MANAFTTMKNAAKAVFGFNLNPPSTSEQAEILAGLEAALAAITAQLEEDGFQTGTYYGPLYDAALIALEKAKK